ncbi:hypothetical protein [Niabella beijingensis]|uniref:hypothetical protein n=1 Tax=Niabella beijingensis TaxID=2872700 RepID=UPI001CBBF6F0|nr:hypothetical protein [Niabella beijingensis]MBZ4188234.1 hypothetical protein [Niabella beijingensis]
MKKIYAFVLALVMCGGVYAQDPSVSGVKVDPNPAQLNASGTFSFNFLNASATAIPLGPVPASITINLNRLTPVLETGNPKVTGAGAGYFDWTYDPTNNVIMGRQNKVIPGETPTVPAGGPIEIEVVFTTAASQAEAGAGNGNGGIINIQPGSGGNLNQTNDQVSGYGYTDGVLPVAFGFTSASFVSGKLKVEWATLTEVDNKSFTIELSKDGKQFTQVGLVPTQAADGNSTAEIKYSFSKNWQEIAAQLGFSPLQLAIMVLLVISVLVSAKRAKKQAMLFSLALLLTVGIGCRKKEKELDQQNYPNAFVRIGQINKDGTTSNYSKVVKVVAE